jgi:excisionase family DNA binding protein
MKQTQTNKMAAMSAGLENADCNTAQSANGVVVGIKTRNDRLKDGEVKLPQLCYTADETAEILKVSQKTVYRLVERKMLHAVKALRHLRITKKSLDNFLASNAGEVAHE